MLNQKQQKKLKHLSIYLKSLILKVDIAFKNLESVYTEKWI